MNEVWDLTPLYKGFDDPAFEADMAAMKQLVADFTAFSKELPNVEPVVGLRRGVELLEKLAMPICAPLPTPRIRNPVLIWAGSWPSAAAWQLPPLPSMPGWYSCPI